MMRIGKIEWFGDQKARRSGSDGNTGSLRSIDKDNNGDFRFYGNAIHGSLRSIIDVEHPDVVGKLVAFKPSDRSAKRKAYYVISLEDVLDENDGSEVFDALCRLDSEKHFTQYSGGITKTDIYNTVSRLLIVSDEPANEKAGVLLACLNDPLNFDFDTLAPYVKNTSSERANPFAALSVLEKVHNNSESRIRPYLEEIVSSNISMCLENFRFLDETKKNIIMGLLPDDFLINERNRIFEQYATERQRQVLREYISGGDKARLEEILARRGIEYFVHFTPVDNLRSIIANGLMTISQLENDHNMVFTRTDDMRLDNQENSISLSVSFPNYKMLYTKKLQNPQTEWCVLLISPKAVVGMDCTFDRSNSASNDSTARREYTSNNKVAAFEDMFADVVGQYNRSEMKDYGTPECERYATDPQAEILCHSPIPIKDIICCCFENEEVLNQYRGILNDHGIACNYKRWYVNDSPYGGYPTVGQNNNASSTSSTNNTNNSYYTNDMSNIPF